MTENKEDAETRTKRIKLDDTQNPPKPSITHCQFFVKRKQRFCKMMVKKDKNFCAEHSTSDEKAAAKRIPCPLDPKHSVEEKNLQKHLQKCNAKEPEKYPEFIKKGCNLYGEEEHPKSEDADKDLKLQDVPLDQIAKVTSKVEKLFAEFIEGKIETNFQSHKSLESELSSDNCGEERKKHLAQTSSILGIMQSEDFFQPQTCFIEYGAGKAALTFYLAQATEDLPKSKILVVDRASHRHKKDNLVKDKEKIERIRADIADLQLSGLSTVDDQTHFAAISKHLCGVATDLTLRCIVNGNCEMSIKTRNVLICVCCHHRCVWRSFTGKKWLELNEIDEKTFAIITRMASWCVCGDRSGGQRKSTKERELIGWKCKRLLDFARIQYLIEHGYEPKLSFYIEKSVTPENVCILAKLKDNLIK